MSAPAVDLEQELADVLATYELDPLGYVEFAFPWGEPGTELEQHTGPRAWQREFLAEIRDRLQAGSLTSFSEVLQFSVASGHGIGKSAIVAWLIKWGTDTREDTRIVVTANTEKQLLSKTWPELAKWHRLSITSHWFTLTATSLYSTDPEHEKTWRADAIAWSETNTEAFAGLHNEGKRIILIFDEASAIADRVWEVAEGALTDANTQIIWAVFGNPTRNIGRFRECFRKFRHRWTPRHIDARTVEGTNRAQLDKMVADHGEDSDIVKVRVRGLFPSAGTKQFISDADVDAAYGRHLHPPQYEYAAKILTVDPSWEGDDPLVIGLRQGLSFRVLKVLPKNDNDVWVANEVARLEDEHQADAVFIDGGFGTGIISVGRTLGRDWLIVWFGAAAGDEGCVNKRAEMWKLMRDWLKEGGAIPPDPELRAELTSVETKPTLDGKLQLASKKEMKAAGVPSPNRADALALSFAFPVLPKALANMPARRYVSDYDPFA